MAIIRCTKPHAGREQGYDPNVWSSSAESTAIHIAESHEASYEGCVLATGEHNWYDDSDFYALVWNEELRAVVEVEYATTRGWTYHNTATVDATPENLSRAVAWKAQQVAEIMHEKLRASKLEDLKRIETGMEIRSLTTRGKNKGVVGYAQRVMKSNYGPGWVVGVQVEGESKTRWLDLERVERTDMPQGDALEEALKPSAEEIGEISRSAVYSAKTAYPEASRLVAV